ncbi:MAG: hypothetical protein LUC97_06365 [Clostridiales bacterium]|nr:hypothetical protein [Clostridiales bacterium]
MGNIVKNYIKKFGDEHRLRNKRLCLLLALAVVVGGGVAWKLHYTGIALTNGTYCGFEEHIHDESCYEYVLICGMEEGALTEGEYEVTPGEDEASGGALEAELPEAHVHTDECYEKVLICDISEHIHTVECLNEEAGGSEASDGESGGGSAAEKTENGETAVLGDENADVETIEEIEASLPSEMSGIWAEDVAAAAESQLGYTESIYNFKLDDDGETHRGYTRYGAWYGNEYGEWNAMFAAFCLHYGGVSEDVFPVNGGAYSWTAVLTEAGLYKEAAGCSPSAGDLVFFDRDKDGKADSVGILTKTESLSEDEETTSRLYVIEGDYSINENESDGVYETVYDTGDESIIGYGILPPQTQTGGEKTMTCEGEGFTVSVTFGADAEIPEKAEFIAEEYEKDSETYIERFAEAAKLYGWDEEDETEAEAETETETEIPALIGELLSFEILTAEAETETETETQTSDDKFRLFSIGFYADGEEIEPKGEVNVEITLTEAEADENTDSISVVHFGEDSHEVLSAEAEYSDGVKTVKFSSESFSDYGIAAVSEEIALLASGEATPDGVYIEDCIEADGTFKAILYYVNEDEEQVEIPYDEDAGYTYTWYQSNEEFRSNYRSDKMTYTDANAPEFAVTADDEGNYDVVDEPTVLSENTVNVAEDLGALRYYYVVVTDSSGKEYTAVKYVEYSDQVENESFEDSSCGSTTYSQIIPENVPYWNTTDYHAYSTTVFSKIEISPYAYTITRPTTYGLVGMHAGNDSNDNQYFVELNCESYATLYQDVLTAPGSNLNWNLYHHCRDSRGTTANYNTYFTEDADKASSKKTVTVKSEDEEGNTTEADYTYTTTKGAANDVMCVVIMSTEDAEKLFSGIDLSDQETVLSAVRESILENESSYNGWTDKDSSDIERDSPKSFGKITGSFKGEYTLVEGDCAGETITAELWRCSTVTVLTTVSVKDSDGSSVKDPTGDLEDDGYVLYTTSSTTDDVTTYTYTYYKSTEWVNYSGDYTVPDSQYLTRFFFVAESATGGSSAGNFLDKVTFSQDIDYTIDYWVWDDETQTYVLQSDDTESGTVEPYTIVTASNISDTSKQYSSLALVGSVTGTSSGGENPESFDTQTTRRIRVRASATHLSLYFKDTGASIIKELNGIPESRLSEVAEETYDVSFYYYNTADGEASGEEITLYANNGLNYNTTGYLDLDKGTYKIKETSYPVSLLNGDYIWVNVNVLVDGEAAEADSDGYYKFTLDDGSATAVIYFTNVYEPAVRLKKTDSTTGSTLSGAEFVMYKTDSGTNYYFMSYNDDGSSNWSADKTVLTTDENGEINFGLLEVGEYYIEEITAPSGYNPLPEGSVLTFVVEDGAVDEKSVILKDGNGTQLEGMTDILLDSSDGTYQIVNLKNDPGVELPSTGGAGKLKYLSAGVMLLFGMACLMIINSRRRKERSD